MSELVQISQAVTSSRRSTSNPNIPDLCYGRLNEKNIYSGALSTVPSFRESLAGRQNHRMSRKLSSPSDSETLVDKLAAKVVREHATEGHTSRTSYISDLPAIQSLIKSIRKRPAVPPLVISQKSAARKDVGCPTGFGWCPGPQMQLQDESIVSSKLGSPKGTRRLSVVRSAVAFSSSSQRKSSLSFSTSP